VWRDGGGGDVDGAKWGEEGALTAATPEQHGLGHINRKAGDTTQTVTVRYNVEISSSRGSFWLAFTVHPF